MSFFNKVFKSLFLRRKEPVKENSVFFGKKILRKTLGLCPKTFLYLSLLTFARVVKNAFIASRGKIGKNLLFWKKNCVVIFVFAGHWKNIFGLVMNVFQHCFQNCFLRVQKTLMIFSRQKSVSSIFLDFEQKW